MAHPSVAITIRSFNRDGPAMDFLKKEFDIVYLNSSGHRLEGEELITAISNAVCVIAGTEKFNRDVIEAVPRLKVISRVGVGIDNIDIDAARERDIKICSTPNAPVNAVAEHTIALLFSLLKNIPVYNTNMRAGDFSLKSGVLLKGKSVGVIGMGRIGQTVALVLSALGCSIVFYDPYLQKPVPGTWERATCIEDLLSRADILTLHTPPLSSGAPIITRELIEKCRPGMIIINTARGSLLDEQALIYGLENGIVFGAALDVFPYEPYDGMLLKYPQVIVTPHVASNTTESRGEMEMEAVKNALAAIQELGE